MANKSRKKKKVKGGLSGKAFLRTPFDWSLILCLILLNIFGLIMIYSASYYYGPKAYGYASDYFFKSQLRFIIIGLVLMFALSFVRPKFYRKLGPIALFLSLALLFAVRIPGIGHASHGAYRWIKLGSLQLQIAEPIKLGIIVYLAAAMTKYDTSNRLVFIMLSFVGLFFAGGILILSNNLSTAIIIFGIFFFMLMLNAKNQKPFVIFMIVVALLAVFAVLMIEFKIPYQEGESFRLTRIRAWLHPTDPLFIDEEAYQPTQALYAIASGGFFGKGLGQSLLKFTLPEPHNDYILSIIFEELGVLGVMILTYLFIYLLYRHVIEYRSTKDKFSRLLIQGIFLHLSIQIVLNYMVVLGLFPTTGVTLPFISYGGTSVLFTLAEMGLVLSAQRYGVELEIYKEAREEVESEDPYLKSLLEKNKREKARKERTAARRR